MNLASCKVFSRKLHILFIMIAQYTMQLLEEQCLNTLIKKDERKLLLCKSQKQQFEIYCYEESEKVFSVCLYQKEKVVVYGQFSLKFIAKEMGYWLSGQMMQKECVTNEEFINASLENGTHKWFIQ